MGPFLFDIFFYLGLLGMRTRFLHGDIKGLFPLSFFFFPFKLEWETDQRRKGRGGGRGLVLFF